MTIRQAISRMSEGAGFKVMFYGGIGVVVLAVVAIVAAFVW